MKFLKFLKTFEILSGLDAETLALCVRLCEQGAHPEALATVIRELRRESQALAHLQEQNQF